jgi:hypothetical protein
VQRGQGPLRPGGGGDPGRSVYIARRAVAALAVLLLIALVGNWAWRALLEPGEQRGSETPEAANVATSSGDERSAAEEGPAGNTEEIVVSQESPNESLQGDVEVGTEGSDIGSPEDVDLTAAIVPAPVPTTPVAPPTITWMPEAALMAPTPDNVPPLPPPPAQSQDTYTNLTAQVPQNLPEGLRPPMIEPIALDEPLSLMGTEVFEEEAPLWGTGFEDEPSGTLGTGAFEEEADLGESTLGENTSGGAAAMAGNAVVAIAGGGATAGSGTVAAVGR